MCLLLWIFYVFFCIVFAKPLCASVYMCLVYVPDFYGDLVYKLKKIVGSNNFSAQFIKIISHYKKIGYNINVLHRLHAWWSTQSRLATMLSSLIAGWWVGLQTL